MPGSGLQEPDPRIAPEGTPAIVYETLRDLLFLPRADLAGSAARPVKGRSGNFFPASPGRLPRPFPRQDAAKAFLETRAGRLPRQ